MGEAEENSLHMQNGTVLETDMALSLGAAGKLSMDAKGGGGLEQHPHLRPDPHGFARARVLPGGSLACAHSPLLLSLSSRSVVSDSLRPHGLQHTRLPWPLLSPGAHTHVH